MFIGYNTNGFAHHPLEDAIAVLAEIGYRGVAITLDHHALNPYASDFAAQRDRVRTLLDDHGLRCAIETGARFFLDPRRKHQPTLLDDDPTLRAKRFDFLRRSIELAAELRADAVSFWSGTFPAGLSDQAAMDRLAEQCAELARFSERAGVRLAFEPEPGMFIDTMSRFETLHERVAHPLFGLTLDVGHVHCLGDGCIDDHLQRWRDRLFNVHLEDMRAGVHDHLMFGEGEMDIPAVLRSLRAIDYPFGAYVELSRHSHDAVATAEASHRYLREAAGMDTPT